MRTNPLQISQIVDRLYAQTKNGKISWEQLSDRKSFQARMADFAITLSGKLSNAEGLASVLINRLGGEATLTIRKFDSQIVAEARTNKYPLTAASATSIYGNYDALDEKTERKLIELFAFLSDRNSDLDDLIKLIG